MAKKRDGMQRSRGIGPPGALARSKGAILRWGLNSVVGALLALGVTGATAETPKRGGILTYMIPADGGPSLDGHRETTYAVVRGPHRFTAS